MSILSISKVRSYCGPEPVNFDLSEPVTMIYGQNGSGKSTISSFFYRAGHPDYMQCKVTPPLNMRTLVFSQEYVMDLFSGPFQPGIFSLSEENAAVRTKIEKLEAKADKIKNKIEKIKAEKLKKEQMADQVRESCAERIRGSVAEIRTTALWNLMDGAKQGSRLYHAITEHKNVLTTSTAELNDEYKALQLSQGNRLPAVAALSLIDINSKDIELLSEVLIPSGNSTLSAAIARLGNADWVASGQGWLIDNVCPFCQKEVDADHLRREISALFDRSWEDCMIRLDTLMQRINEWLDTARRWSDELLLCPLADRNGTLINALNELIRGWSENVRLVEQKITTPSEPVYLKDLSEHTKSFNTAYEGLSVSIIEHNLRADNYQTEYHQLKQRLRSHIRQLSINAISTHNDQLAELDAEKNTLSAQKHQLTNELMSLNAEIHMLNGQIVNCSDTVNKINDGLEALGITGFKIRLHNSEQDAYCLERNHEVSQDGVFHTLSEGEKTLIAFLYFLETCQGRSSREELDIREKLIVIDDPISSLSQNYIFEIASLIQQQVIQNQISGKVLILTHSLFFFQEMLLSAKKKKNKNTGVPEGWRLYRLTKHTWSTASLITGKALMNDYQAMWHVLKESRNEQVASVIIPNTMRQILEYYFGFSGKSISFSSALERLAHEQRESGFRAFARYINRHSHADARNIKLLETASVAHYLGWFERVFEAVDAEHYRLMMAEEE